MLYAKISPAAKLAAQSDAFNVSIIDLNYMTASADPYRMGAQIVHFSVLFGILNLDESNIPTDFITRNRIGLDLADTDIATWGFNDNELLTVIATKLGTTITEFLTL